MQINQRIILIRLIVSLNMVYGFNLIHFNFDTFYICYEQIDLNLTSLYIYQNL